MNPRPLLLAATALCLTATGASAQVALWNFNSVPADANSATGTVNPVFGTGTVTGIGGVTTTFANGDANGGSSDPTTGDDSGFQTAGYPTQGSGNQTAGLQFNISTVGYNVTTFTFDLRTSNTASRHFTVLYSLNGADFTPSGVVFATPGGDTWNNVATVDFSGIAGVSDNPNFAVRIVSTFDPANGTAYTAANTGSTYAATGTYRFDMVTLNGTVIPEPSAVALGTLGLAGLLALRRRR